MVLMIRKCYPNGNTKAFSVSYDDGVLQNVRLVALLNRYGIRGTFNLNSRLMREEFAWIHENGMTVRRLDVVTAQNLYGDHEIASHTLSHPYMDSLTEAEIMEQMAQDKVDLEAIFGRKISGFAVPFTYYSDLIADCARRCGFTYARMSDFFLSFDPWQDRYYWKSGVFHLQPELMDFVEAFLRTDQELALCQIVGHSYDLDAENLWDTTEDIFRRISRRKDIWRATNLEIVEYLMAMNKAELGSGFVRNTSCRELWFMVSGNVICLRPGEIYKEDCL